jgi:hypothetical protein
MPIPGSKPLQVGVALFSLIFSVVAIASVDWVVTEDAHTGLFSYKTGGSVKDLKCDSMMSQTQCGYLQSSQNSSVISIIFCFLCFAWLVQQYSAVSPMNSLVAFALSFLQFSFGITSVVVYNYFKNDYLSADDGVNVEYPTNTYSHFLYGYYFWISVTAGAFIVSFLSGVELFRLSKADGPMSTKGIRDLETMN